jgi:transcriptional regulator with XRE-family HTH domain
MQFVVAEQIAQISRRIRRLREDDSLTLQGLAERGGLATSTVQKVETGQMMPSLAVLLKLAHGFGRPISELLEDDDPTIDVFHGKACERECLGGSVVAERLSGNLPKACLETWQVTLDPGASSGSDPIQYEGEELVVCEQGSVTFRLGEKEYVLEAGDSLHFKARIPHSWYNDASDRARFTITGTHPLLFRSVMKSRISAPARVDELPGRLEEPDPRLLATP